MQTVSSPKTLKNFLSAEPDIQLTKAFTTPFQNVIATARTCYSSKGIIDDATISMEKWGGLAKSIYEAGHHTTFQHAQFQFAMSNISRQFIWSFLHSHPFYNSEQVSQRYVEVKPETFAVPPMEGEAKELYLRTIEMQHAAYKNLIELLMPPTAAAFFKRFPYREKYKEKYAKDIKKKSQEIARYVLPVATFAYMYHTVSGITLLRYWRMAEQFDTPLETRIVLQKMVDALLAYDSNYALVLQEPIPLEETPEYKMLQEYAERISSGVRSDFLREFDESLNGRVSKLVDHSLRGEETLANSVREMFGATRKAMSDDEAINLVLNPAKDTILGESLVLTTHSKLARAMYHPHYTFRKKLSHTADSQDQRHRMTPASRPVLHLQLTETPDFITPEIVKHEPAAEKLYNDTMAKSWETYAQLKAHGVPEEYAMYVLPNALPVRFTESSDLLNLQHKHAMRLCYNAQEEIWRASLDEAQQIRQVHPRIGAFLLPPCTLRDLAGTRPICPEGDRFCGEKVWRLDLDEYERVI
jgi:thymidylate synthase ThyX